MERADDPFDTGDTWDQREYAPLTDIIGGTTRSSGLDFSHACQEEERARQQGVSRFC